MMDYGDAVRGKAHVDLRADPHLARKAYRRHGILKHGFIIVHAAVGIHCDLVKLFHLYTSFRYILSHTARFVNACRIITV